MTSCPVADYFQQFLITWLQEISLHSTWSYKINYIKKKQKP